MAVIGDGGEGSGGGGGVGGAGGSGLIELVTGDFVLHDNWNANFKNVQSPQLYAELPGVLAGGVCTVSGLNVVVPVGTIWYTRALWLVTVAAVNVAITDNSTEFVWGCSDGLIRKTAGLDTLPAGFDNRHCCRITKGVALAGALTVDNTVQQKGRYSDPATRIVTDGPLQIDYANNLAIILSGGGLAQMDSIATGRSMVVASGYQSQLFDRLRVYGSLRVYGKVRVTD